MGEKSQIKELLDWIMHIAVAVLAGLLIVTFVAQRTIVFNYSMEPTLYQGDNLIVEKLGPRLGRLKSGDIVTIKDASDFLSEEENRRRKQKKVGVYRRKGFSKQFQKYIVGIYGDN